MNIYIVRPCPTNFSADLTFCKTIFKSYVNDTRTHYEPHKEKIEQLVIQLVLQVGMRSIETWYNFFYNMQTEYDVEVELTPIYRLLLPNQTRL